MSEKRGRGWYWKVHGKDYKRASVDMDVDRFCGWDFLLRIVKECENTKYSVSPMWGEEYAKRHLRSLVRRDQALIATLFETGGRILEVLRLRRRNFDFSDERWV